MKIFKLFFNKNKNNSILKKSIINSNSNKIQNNNNNMENQKEKEKEEKENLLIMNNNKSLAVELKNLTRNAGMKSSIHCLPNISDRKTFSTVKVVWFLITATSWIFWLIQTYGLNQLYNEHNVITNYKQGVDSEMEFPGKYMIIF